MPLFRRNAMVALKHPKLFWGLSLVLAMAFGWYCIAAGRSLEIFVSIVALYVVIAGLLFWLSVWMTRRIEKRGGE